MLSIARLYPRSTKRRGFTLHPRKQIPLKYQFLKDAENYPLASLTRSLPTLILHGINDDVVPIQVSRDYASTHPQAKLIELDSDHGLNDVKEIIWQEIKSVLKIQS